MKMIFQSYNYICSWVNVVCLPPNTEGNNRAECCISIMLWFSWKSLRLWCVWWWAFSHCCRTRRLSGHNVEEHFPHYLKCMRPFANYILLFLWKSCRMFICKSIKHYINTTQLYLQAFFSANILCINLFICRAQYSQMFFNLLNLVLHIKLIIKKNNIKIILSHKQFIITAAFPFHSIILPFF